jgi:uncharacterized Zn-finger protein
MSERQVPDVTLAEIRNRHPAPEEQVVGTWRVACDGGEAALGHPRVWLSIPQDRGWVECGYCDKRYIHEDFADGA